VTVPPLPASPCLRVRLGYTDNAGTDAGNRFYLSYSGGAPTSAQLTTLATDIATAWASNLASVVYTGFTLTEVDIVDITTLTGASATVAVSHAGTDSSGAVTTSVATNIEFEIARRYRGGKPRMFLPPAGLGNLSTSDKWTTTFIGAVNTGIAGFFTAIAALSVGSMTALTHVNLSYYKGFTNLANSSGRERAVPQYKATATLDTITGYSTKAVVGAQRRRRTATTF
jgi:hypothetical protein